MKRWRLVYHWYASDVKVVCYCNAENMHDAMRQVVGVIQGPIGQLSESGLQRSDDPEIFGGASNQVSPGENHPPDRGTFPVSGVNPPKKVALSFARLSSIHELSGQPLTK